jgi:uncharacterized protein (TIRG00374 family)
MDSVNRLIKRIRWPVLLGVGISLLLLYVALRNVRWVEFLGAFRDARPGPLLLAEGVLLVGFWLRAVRWRYLLKPLGEFPSVRLFPAILIGFFSNFVLPARSGELVRVVALGVESGLSKSAVLASIAVERVLDGLVLAGFLLLGLWWVPAPAWVIAVLRAAVAVFGIAFLLLVLLARCNWQSPNLIERLSARLPVHIAGRIASLSRAFLDGLQSLRSGRLLGYALFLSAAAWLASVASQMLAAQALRIDLSPAVFLLLVAILNLSILIPTVPGHVGVIEFVGVSLLALFDIPEGRALVYVVLSRVVMLGPLLLGFFFLNRMGINLLGGLSGASAKVQGSGAQE